MQELFIESVKCNTDTVIIFENIRVNRARPLPRLAVKPAHDGSVTICGGGPSLKRMAPFPGTEVWALNAVHDYLIDRRGIVPTRLVICDARPECAKYVENADDRVDYYIATQCDPSVFDALEGQKVVSWDVQNSGVLPVEGEILVAGGSTALLNAMAIAFIEGYREIHLIGADSCYEDDAHHAYSQALNDGDDRIDVHLNGKTYYAASWMVSQAIQFQDLVKNLTDKGALIYVHGTGLIPDIARAMAQ